MKRRFILSISLLLCICLITVGCSAPGSQQASSNTQNTDTKVYELKFSHQSADNVGLAKEAIEISEEVAKRTDGKVKITVYGNAVLGSERQNCESLQTEAIAFTFCTTATLAGFCKSYSMSDLPYLFKSWEAAEAFMKSDISSDLNKELEKVSGLTVIATQGGGYRQLTNNVRPVYTPKDLEGIKIRVMQSDIFIDTFKALGAYPVAMAKAEVYTGLQQHTIDAQENPPEINFNEGLYDVQKYMSMTNHVFQVVTVLSNQKVLDGLPEDLRKIVLDVFKEKTEKYHQIAKEDAELYKEKLAEKGMEINEVENIDAFRQIVIDKVYPKYQEIYGDYLTRTLELLK